MHSSERCCTFWDNNPSRQEWTAGRKGPADLQRPVLQRWVTEGGEGEEDGCRVDPVPLLAPPAGFTATIIIQGRTEWNHSGGSDETVKDGESGTV